MAQPIKGYPTLIFGTLALTESRTLVTTDKGFTQYRALAHYGILVVRLRQPNRQKIHSAVMRAIGQFAASDWMNLLVVVRDTTMSTSRAHSAGGDPVE